MYQTASIQSRMKALVGLFLIDAAFIAVCYLIAAISFVAIDFCLAQDLLWQLLEV